MVDDANTLYLLRTFLWWLIGNLLSVLIQYKNTYLVLFSSSPKS